MDGYGHALPGRYHLVGIGYALDDTDEDDNDDAEIEWMVLPEPIEEVWGDFEDSIDKIYDLFYSDSRIRLESAVFMVEWHPTGVCVRGGRAAPVGGYCAGLWAQGDPGMG